MEIDFVLSQKFKKKHIRVLDIGAHHGELLDIFSNYNHPHFFEIYSVEPLSRNIRKLRSKALKYKILNNIKCTIIPYAISDKHETKKFFLGSSDTLFTCDETWKEKFSQEFINFSEIDISCLTLSEISQEYFSDNLYFDLIKIDTEGHDLNIIRSLNSSDIKADSIIFEASSDMVTNSSCIKLLTHMGFTNFFFFGRHDISTRFIGEITDLKKVENLFESEIVSSGNIVAFS